jgi:thioredoxin 1
MVHIQTYNDRDFDLQVLKTSKPVLIMFMVEWSGMCRMAMSILQRFADRNPGVKVGKVDIEESMSTASRYDVDERTVPHCIFFENGNKVREATHVITLDKIDALLGR